MLLPVCEIWLLIYIYTYIQSFGTRYEPCFHIYTLQGQLPQRVLNTSYIHIPKGCGIHCIFILLWSTRYGHAYTYAWQPSGSDQGYAAWRTVQESPVTFFYLGLCTQHSVYMDWLTVHCTRRSVRLFGTICEDGRDNRQCLPDDCCRKTTRGSKMSTMVEDTYPSNYVHGRYLICSDDGNKGFGIGITDVGDEQRVEVWFWQITEVEGLMLRFVGSIPYDNTNGNEVQGTTIKRSERMGLFWIKNQEQFTSIQVTQIHPLRGCFVQSRDAESSFLQCSSPPNHFSRKATFLHRWKGLYLDIVVKHSIIHGHIITFLQSWHHREKSKLRGDTLSWHSSEEALAIKTNRRRRVVKKWSTTLCTFPPFPQTHPKPLWTAGSW